MHIPTSHKKESPCFAEKSMFAFYLFEQISLVFCNPIENIPVNVNQYKIEILYSALKKIIINIISVKCIIVVHILKFH